MIPGQVFDAKRAIAAGFTDSRPEHELVFSWAFRIRAGHKDDPKFGNVWIAM